MTLTILKRGTALAALATLPLALCPVTAGAQNQQTQSQQTQGEQAQTETIPDTQSGQTQTQATSEEKDPANETGIVTEGKEGTQSGNAPDKAPTGDQAGQAQGGQQTQSGQQAGQAQTGRAGQQDKAGAGQDVVVAKVGDREIRQSDVLDVIALLPPELQQQPPETLIPIALDQLVMRELILQKAKDAGFENDPAVTSLAPGDSQPAKEDAMIRVWLDRELGDAVTDQKVEETYDAVKQQMGDQAPSMEALRPQIEQELRQQAFLELGRDLQADAEITLYGPDGQPITR